MLRDFWLNGFAGPGWSFWQLLSFKPELPLLIHSWLTRLLLFQVSWRTGTTAHFPSLEVLASTPASVLRASQPEILSQLQAQSDGQFHQKMPSTSLSASCGGWLSPNVTGHTTNHTRPVGVTARTWTLPAQNRPTVALRRRVSQVYNPRLPEQEIFLSI